MDLLPEDNCVYQILSLSLPFVVALFQTDIFMRHCIFKSLNLICLLNPYVKPKGHISGRVFLIGMFSTVSFLLIVVKSKLYASEKSSLPILIKIQYRLFYLYFRYFWMLLFSCIWQSTLQISSGNTQKQAKLAARGGLSLISSIMIFFFLKLLFLPFSCHIFNSAETIIICWAPFIFQFNAQQLWSSHTDRRFWLTVRFPSLDVRAAAI